MEMADKIAQGGGVAFPYETSMFGYRSV
jgi:hypothetical protein